MERRVRLPEGELAYIWTRKRVKNWNLRVSPDGTVTLSTPTGVTGAEADRYVIGKPPGSMRPAGGLPGGNPCV